LQKSIQELQGLDVGFLDGDRDHDDYQETIITTAMITQEAPKLVDLILIDHSSSPHPYIMSDIASVAWPTERSNRSIQFLKNSI
jgi:hypothetical protein